MDRARIETSIATMTLVEPGFIEQRFHPGGKITLQGFAENKAARLELCEGARHVMLSVFPPDIDFELSVTQSDHFAPERSADLLVALAVVVGDNMVEMITKLYFSYFPQVFHTRICATEEEARTWLKQYVPEEVSA